MSNTTTINPFILTINSIQKNIGIYGYSMIFLLGNIGSLLNVLIFIQRNYRKNSCSCYILASTIANLIILNIIVLFRILGSFNIDPTKTSWFFCRFRVYIAQMVTVLSRCYLLLACIDRWAMTSTIVRRRAFANLKISNILIPTIAIISIVSFLHVPFYQNIVRGRCMVISANYAKFYNIYNTILTGIVIPSLMFIFSFLTMRNVSQLKRRVQQNTIVNTQNLINNTIYESQLVTMMITQQISYLISNIPFVSYLLYDVLTMNTMKSNVQIAIDSLYMTIVYMLVHINFSVTFYIYMLTSSIFRKNLKQLVFHNRLTRIWFGNPNSI